MSGPNGWSCEENLEKRTYGVILADKRTLVNENITYWCEKWNVAEKKSNSTSSLEADFKRARTEQNSP
jgi:hypothetical protein